MLHSVPPWVYLHPPGPALAECGAGGGGETRPWAL